MGEVPEKSRLEIVVDAGTAAGELTPELAAYIREIDQSELDELWDAIFRVLGWHDGHEAAFQFVAGELVYIAAAVLRGIRTRVGEELSPESFANRCQLTAQDVLAKPNAAQWFSDIFGPPSPEPRLPGMRMKKQKHVLDSLVAEFLSSQPALVNRDTIIAAVASRYAEAYPGFSPPTEYNINMAINRLHAKRILKNHKVPYSKEESLFSLESGAQVPTVEPNARPTPPPAPSPEPVRKLVPEEEIGEGDELVYVYFNEAERSLAKYEGRDWWPCKVGFTKFSLSERLMAQTPHTGIGRLPVVGLVIRTENGRALERALHFALEKVATRMGDALGTEWFETTPGKIKDWYRTTHAAAAVLRRETPPHGHVDGRAKGGHDV